MNKLADPSHYLVFLIFNIEELGLWSSSLSHFDQLCPFCFYYHSSFRQTSWSSALPHDIILIISLLLDDHLLTLVDQLLRVVIGNQLSRVHTGRSWWQGKECNNWLYRWYHYLNHWHISQGRSTRTPVMLISVTSMYISFSLNLQDTG